MISLLVLVVVVSGGQSDQFLDILLLTLMAYMGGYVVATVTQIVFPGLTASLAFSTPRGMKIATACFIVVLHLACYHPECGWLIKTDFHRQRLVNGLVNSTGLLVIALTWAAVQSWAQKRRQQS